MKGFSRLLSIFKTIYLIMKDYDDSEEFDEIKPFYSYIAQILCEYLENYIKVKKFDLDKLESFRNSLAYNYAIFGFSFYKGKTCLLLDKFFTEEGENNKILEIPIPITKKDEWYNDLRINNL